MLLGDMLGRGEGVWSVGFITGATRRPITDIFTSGLGEGGREVTMVESPTLLARLLRVNKIPRIGLKIFSDILDFG